MRIVGAILLVAGGLLACLQTMNPAVFLAGTLALLLGLILAPTEEEEQARARRCTIGYRRGM